jgi:hypothetical protein
VLLTGKHRVAQNKEATRWVATRIKAKSDHF